MKKILPLLASLLMLAACGQTNTQDASKQEPAETSQAAETSATTNYKLTFLEDAEIYVDFNFTNKPEGLTVKVGNVELTESGKAKMTKGFDYEVGASFVNPINIYHIVDTGSAVSVGKSEGVDAEVASQRIGRYLENFANTQYGYRVYFCLSDKANGWSTTLPGVNESMNSNTGLLTA